MRYQLRPSRSSIIPLCSLGLFAVIVLAAAFALPHSSQAQDNPAALDCPIALDCALHNTDQLGLALQQLTPPVLTAPPLPQPSPTRPTTGIKHITYSVTTRGNVTADFATFKTLAQQTYDDDRGWKRLGVTFSPVASGGNFTLVLATADQLPIFSPGCSSLYSCRVGRYVIINQDRWQGATDSWNKAGGSLRDYRHMVVNHETGHWLGHGHANCTGAGQPAPVMQQQSIDLQGCSFNAWPVAAELHSSTLGL